MGKWALLLCCLWASCGGTVRGYAGKGNPSCHAVCDHYTTCRRLPDDDVFAACVSECKEVFYQEGKPDKNALRQFQKLHCKAAVAFVEGSGSPPGRRKPIESIEKQ